MAVLALLFLGVAPEVKAEPCASAASCNQLGTELLHKGNISQAIEVFRLQVADIESEEREPSRWAIAYNNLAVAFIHKQEYYAALAWTKVALNVVPDNAAAQHNLTVIQQHLANNPWPKDIGGTYIRYAGHGDWSYLCAEQRGQGLSFSLFASRAGGGSSYCDITDKGVFTSKDTVSYSGDADFPACRVEMTFAADNVSIKQGGDCGCGYGAKATGSYERISLNGDQNCGQHLP